MTNTAATPGTTGWGVARSDDEWGSATADHQRLTVRRWTDPEPDTLSISVETCEGSGKAVVVFTCSSTWLDPHTVRDEIVPWLLACCTTAETINDSE